MRGRRPKPTRLKMLTGNPGKRPFNMNEPKPDAEIPDLRVWIYAGKQKQDIDTQHSRAVTIRPSRERV